VKKEVWNGALLCCCSQFFCRQSSGRILYTFPRSLLKHHSSMWNWLFGLPGWILHEQFSWCKRKMDMTSALLLTCLTFSFSVGLDFPCTIHAFFPDRLPSHCQGLRGTSNEICTKLNAILLSGPSRNHIRPDRRLKINGRKKSAHPPSCTKLCALTPKIC
jgi:hypothetical protein